ncbi:hypothetical protein F4679DRAFT_350588 [Xylaria curta]|nr:hypothetical protein F4679DRAFT_350588 [Xylaria curta]
MMNSTVKFAKDQWRLRMGVNLSIKSLKLKMPQPELLYLRGTHKVDFYLAIEDHPPRYLVVGLGRPSSKFAASKTALAPNEARSMDILALRELALACKRAQTRYGYLVTDEALVACRFSKETSQDQFDVEMQPAVWSKWGTKHLTTDLALWWLCMLALSKDQGVTITRKTDMADISTWRTIYDDRGQVQRHVYSGYERVVNDFDPNVGGVMGPGVGYDFGSFNL